MVKFKPIYPKAKNVDKVRLEVLSMLHRVGRDIQKDYKNIVSNWEHKPEFSVMIAVSPYPSVIVETNDDVFGMLNKGIPPHEIWAGKYTGKSNAKTLAFPWAGYGSKKPKSKPRLLGSLTPSVPGTMVMKPYVSHPGVEAREWDIAVTEKWQSEFVKECEDAIRKGLIKAGFQYV